MDVVFDNAFHRDLYARVKLGDAAEAWGRFEEKYPDLARHRDDWLASRRPGVGPIDIGVPWINYPAIAFLTDALKGKRRAFEWGMGGSTIFLRRQLPFVVSVEHDAAWFSAASSKIATESRSLRLLRRVLRREESECILSPPGEGMPGQYGSGAAGYQDRCFEDYVRTIERWPDGHFDLVLVDGRARMACLWAGWAKVRPGGVLMLDNSDYARYATELEALSRAHLSTWSRTDFLGPGPCSKVVGWRTTVWVRPTGG